MESDSVLYGLLGRIHLLMRRVTNRITDVEYMRTNKDYAREIVRLADASGHDELRELAGRLRDAMDLDAAEADTPSTPAPAPRSGFFERLRSPAVSPEGDKDRYVRSLR